MGCQVYETQTELTEAREELELLKLKLDVADQEAQAAKRQAAEATAATAALLQGQDSPGLPSPVNRRSLSREVNKLLARNNLYCHFSSKFQQRTTG